MYLRTTLVDSPAFCQALQELGGIYFIRNTQLDTVKIGYSTSPWDRLTTLQVANSARLEMIGLVAAEQRIEKLIHQQHTEGHASGEWFYDRGILSGWLRRMTDGQPMCRHVWRLVPHPSWQPDQEAA